MFCGTIGAIGGILPAAAKRDLLLALAVLELAGLVSDPVKGQQMHQSSAELMRGAVQSITEALPGG